jgi:hypothetical protein
MLRQMPRHLQQRVIKSRAGANLLPHAEEARKRRLEAPGWSCLLSFETPRSQRSLGCAGLLRMRPTSLPPLVELGLCQIKQRVDLGQRRVGMVVVVHDPVLIDAGSADIIHRFAHRLQRGLAIMDAA